jgi:hypothetical protein
MRHALHRTIDCAAIVDCSLDDLDPIGLCDRAIVTERFDACFAPSRFPEKLVKEIPANLARRPCDQQLHGVLPHGALPRGARLSAFMPFAYECKVTRRADSCAELSGPKFAHITRAKL